MLFSIHFAEYIFLCIILLLICVIDWFTMRIPDILTVCLCAIGFYENGIANINTSICLTLIFGAIKFFMDKKHGKIALGLGDIKLVFACGLFLSISQAHIFIILCGFLSCATYFLRKKSACFPMGPAICVSLAAILKFVV